MQPPPARSRERRASALLGLGAAAGLAVAAAALLAPRSDPGSGLPRDAVAAVNGEPLRVEDYERAVAALASDRRDPIGEAEKRHVLDRMLDEELLVQRGVELGLVRHDRRVRGDLVAAVIQAVVSRADDQTYDEDAVRSFYERNRDYFARTGRVLVEAVWVRGPPLRSDEEAQRRAGEVVRRLRAGEPAADVEKALGDPPVARVPHDLLPATKLREYLGPTLTKAALALQPGDVSEPLRQNMGFQVLRVAERLPGEVPPLAEIEDEVRAELRRRAGDRALRDYLAELRGRADVRVASELP